MSMSCIEQISSHEWCRRYRRYLKKARARRERHKARKNPETPITYRKFYGYSI